MRVFNQVNWVTSATMVCSVGSPQDHRTRLSLKYNPKRKHPSPMISLNQNNIPEFQNLFIEIQNLVFRGGCHPKKNRPWRLHQFLGRLRCVGIAGDARGHGDQIKESGCRGRQAFFGANRCIPKNRWRPKKQQWLIEFNYVYVPPSISIICMYIYI